MKYYTVTNRFKKSVDETEIIVGTVDDVEVRIAYTTNWRSAEFRIGVPETKDEIADYLKYQGYDTVEELLEDYEVETLDDIVLPPEDEDYIEMCDYYEWEMLSTYDGCSEDYVIHVMTEDDDVVAEITEKIENVIEEEGLWGLFDELGLESDDCVYEIHNGVIVEEEQEQE
jgi:hypothetical protein